MSTNLEYREERDRESRRQASKAQREKERQTEREIKDKGDIFLLEEQNEIFLAAVGK